MRGFRRSGGPVGPPVSREYQPGVPLQVRSARVRPDTACVGNRELPSKRLCKVVHDDHAAARRGSDTGSRYTKHQRSPLRRSFLFGVGDEVGRHGGAELDAARAAVAVPATFEAVEQERLQAGLSSRWGGVDLRRQRAPAERGDARAHDARDLRAGSPHHGARAGRRVAAHQPPLTHRRRVLRRVGPAGDAHDQLPAPCRSAIWTRTITSRVSWRRRCRGRRVARPSTPAP